MSDDEERPAQPDSSESGPSVLPQSESHSLSKNALKKAARAERFAAYKLERRAKEKEAKKEKKRVLQAKRAAGEIDEDENKKRRSKKPKLHFDGRVVVDLGFDDKMNEKVGCARPVHILWIVRLLNLGNKIFMLPVGVHVQCEPKFCISLFTPVHLAQRPHVDPT